MSRIKTPKKPRIAWMPALFGTWQSHWSEHVTNVAYEKMSGSSQSSLNPTKLYQPTLWFWLRFRNACWIYHLSPMHHLTLPNAAFMVSSIFPWYPLFQGVLGGSGIQYWKGICQYAGCSEGLSISQAIEERVEKVRFQNMANKLDFRAVQ